MTIGDLPTAAEYGANILIVVLNDGAFGQTYMQQTGPLRPHLRHDLPEPELRGHRQACGAEGIRVTDPKDVESALAAGARGDEAEAGARRGHGRRQAVSEL
jgi:acetolactate synthase-1/2/3 large subunit